MAKVLLVEDDNNLREIYEARLQAEGYDIVSAKDGEEALVVAKEEKPDLIISDVMMPKISGFEMLDILRNTAGLKETKVIMLTALGQAEDQSRADRLGADKYLVKSQVTLEDIVKVSHELLGDNAEPEPTDTSIQTNTSPETSNVANTPVVEPPTTPQPAVPVTPEPMAVEPQPNPTPEPNIINTDNNQQVTSNPELSTVTPQPEPVLNPVVEPPTTPQPAVPVTPEPMSVEPQSSPMPDPIVNNNPIEDSQPTLQQQTTPSQTEEHTDEADNTPQINIDPTGQLTQTEAQETEQMDHTIQEFLNNTPTAENPNVQSNDQPLTSRPQPQSTNNQVANDQTLAQAVNNLMSGEADNESNGPLSNGQQTQPAPPSTPVTTNNTPQSTSPSTSNSVEISGKKIINPINQEPKKSFEELVAQEEASSVNNPSENQINKPFNPDDPNNIAI